MRKVYAGVKAYPVAIVTAPARCPRPSSALTRAGLQLLRAAKARAAMAGRVVPDDITDLAEPTRPPSFLNSRLTSAARRRFGTGGHSRGSVPNGRR